MFIQLRKDLIQFLRWLRTNLGRFLGWLFNLFSPIANAYFALTWEGSIIRTSLPAIAFFVWTWFAYTTQPPDFSNVGVTFQLEDIEDPQLILIYQMLGQLIFLGQLVIALVKPYVVPEVLRHVLMVGLAIWIAYRIASIYLDDIFELDDVSVASRFIRQILFVSRYERIFIREGDIAPQSKNSPVYRIGGPGRAIVQFENAALFERIDGNPQVIGPGRPARLEGFERLRSVIDLRDQEFKDITVRARTKDGIIVRAKDVRAVISIHRGAKLVQANGDQGPRKLSYSPKAIQNLVYNQGNRPWIEAAKSGITVQLGRFIQQHTLSEFLATITPEEIKALQNAEAEKVGTGGATPTRSNLGTLTDAAAFKSRSEITDYFYEFMQGNPEAAEARGYDLQWLGIGTWDTPDIIPEQHLRAWEISAKNRIDGSEWELNKIRRDSRRKELIRLIQEVPINAFAMLISQQGADVEEIKRQLLMVYREKLNRAYESIQEQGELPPDELVEALRHLSKW